MTSLTPFSFESSSIRVITHADGNWSVVAKDVCDALGYAESTISNIEKTIAHVPDEWKGRYPIPTLGGTQQLWCLAEPGLYFFLGRSDKPKALPFQKWIFGDVAPSIRKTGSYAMPDTQPAADPDANLGAELAELLRGKIVVDKQALINLVRDMQLNVMRTLMNDCEPIEDALGSGSLSPLKQALTELNRAHGKKAPAPRRPIPDHERILDAILIEIEQNTYPYPHGFREIDGIPCLIIRTRHIMNYLRDTPRLRALYQGLKSTSDRVLKSDLRKAGLIVQMRMGPVLNGQRMDHAIAIRLAAAVQQGLALH